jgi:hypothetical protein
MMIAGIVMAGLGGLAVVAGSIEYAEASGFCDAFGSRSFNGDSCANLYRVLGATELVVGGVLVAVGLPLAIVGSGKPEATPAALAPSLRLGKRDAALVWAF